jgi:hypothetical protein
MFVLDADHADHSAKFLDSVPKKKETSRKPSLLVATYDALIGSVNQRLLDSRLPQSPASWRPMEFIK